MKNILEQRYLIVSSPWATNDITEGVAQKEEKQSENIKQYGYICMSKTCTSPAMWGYYADRSRGACLVFDIDEDSDYAKKYPIQEVKYEEKRLDTTDVTDLLSCKSTDWQHEKECRIIFKLSELQTRKRPENSEIFFIHHEIMKYLSGIILGVNCNSECAQIQSIAKDVKVIRIQISPEKFEFTMGNARISEKKRKTLTRSGVDQFYNYCRY